MFQNSAGLADPRSCLVPVDVVRASSEHLREMAASTNLLQFLLMVVAGWLHRQQAAVIEYLSAENRVLRERLGDRRFIFIEPDYAWYS